MKHLALLATLAVAASTNAQVVFDDFEDPDFSNTFAFSQSGSGIQRVDDPGRLAIAIDPAQVGDFLGFGVRFFGGGTVDVSGAETLLLPVIVAADAAGTTTPFTLEVYLLEDSNGNGFDGADDQFRFNLPITPNQSSEVAIPLASFFDNNGGGRRLVRLLDSRRGHIRDRRDQHAGRPVLHPASRPHVRARSTASDGRGPLVQRLRGRHR